jgi:DNA-binding response OmpR family regulator
MTETKKKRILIAEDEKAIAKAIRLKLESEGFEIESVYDGVEAIQKIEEDKKVKKSFDFMLLDIVMPNKNGFDVLEHLKKNKIKTPPVFVLSNLSQEEDSVKAKELGAVEFIIKSNTPLKEIISKIKSYI